MRTMLALTLGIAEHKVRVIAPDVGGGFGGKIPLTPEEVLTTLVARKLNKPAKYTESRSESLMAAHHGRDQIQDITITAKKDGTVTGLDVHLLADMGAYLRLVGPGVPVLGAFMFNAIYKFPAYRFVCDGIFTNKTPTDAYRGAGRPRRRSRSSGSWTNSRTSSAWTRWSCAARTGSSTRSSRSPRSAGSPTTAATTRPRPTRPSS